MLLLEVFSLADFPIATLGPISAFHVIIAVLLSLALGTGSRGITPAILLVIAGVVLLVVGCYMLHRLRHPERSKLRNMLTFGLLFPATLIHSILLLIRAGNRELHADLATLDNPHQVAVALVALSCSATLFGTARAFESPILLLPLTARAALVSLCLSPFSRDAELPQQISKDEIGLPRKLGYHGTVIHHSERLVTLPVKPGHPWNPTKTQSSCAASTRTLNVTTQTIRQHDGFETTYVTWTDIPL